jgi:glycosyltransferase involved in cell wall biosynthesis
MKVEISVVIPNYNRTTKTLSAVASVLCQTYPVLEILIVDDGSNAKTLDYLESEIRPMSNKVKIIEMSHSGHPGIVRNKGISISKGSWIAFLDSDDAWKPTKIETQVRRCLGSGAKAIGECSPGSKQGRNSWLLLDTRKLMKTNYLICSSVMVEKSLIESVGIFPSSNYSIGVEDYITWLKVSTETSWHLSTGREVEYDLTTEESLSKSEKTQSHFSHEIALLQFADWKLGKTRKSSLRLKVFNKILQRAI